MPGNEFDLIAKVRGDLDELEKQLEGDVPKSAARAGTKAGKSFGDNFSKAIKAIAGAAIIKTIGNAFSSATRKAIEFERQFIALDAAARNLGKSQDDVRAKVLSLAEDGAISLETLSQSYRVLLSLGKTTDDAFQILDAAKRVGVLNNTVGDANLALQGFVKFIATGEAELADNLDPTLKAVARDLGGYAKVANDATVQQKFLNAVIEKGAALQGDYNKFVSSGAGLTEQLAVQNERLQATLGSIILDAFEPLLRIAVEGAKLFREFLESLSQTAQAVVVLGGTAAVALAGFSVLIGPIAFGFAAVVAGVTALVAAFDKLVVTTDEIEKAAIKSANEYVRLEKQFGKNSKATNDLVDANSALAQSAQALQIALNNENGQLKTNAELLEEIKQKKLANLRADRAALAQSRLELARSGRLGTGALLLPARGGDDLIRISARSRERSLRRGDEGVKRSIRLFDNLEQVIRNIDAQIEKILNPPRSREVSLRRTGERARKKLVELERSTALVRFDIERDLIQKETDERVKNLEMWRKQQLASAKLSAEQRADIERKYQRERQRILVDGLAQEANLALENASKVATGIQQSFGAETAGQSISALGNVAGAALGPQAQAAFQSAGTIVDVVEGLFRSGENIAEQLDRRIEQERAIADIIEAQVEFQKKLLELDRERNRQISVNAERQLRINALLIDDENELLEANRGVLRELLSERAVGVGLPADQDVDVQALSDRIGGLQDIVRESTIPIAAIKNVVDASENGGLYAPTTAGIALRASLIQQLQQAKGSGVPGADQRIDEAIGTINQVSATILATAKGSTIAIRYARALEQGDIGRIQELERIRDWAEVVLPNIQRRVQEGIGGQTLQFLRERRDLVEAVQRDTQVQIDNSDEIISILERLRAIDDQIAESTNVDTLELGRDRESSFIDVSRRGIVDRGDLVQAVNLQNIGLTGGLQSITVGIERQRSFQERTADALESLDTKATKRNDLLAMILQALAENTSSVVEELNSLSGQGIGTKI